MARVFSGIQPTGTKHLGNYIGAIRHYVADQDTGEAFYCVVDLHAISVPYEPAALHENTLDTAATLLYKADRVPVGDDQRQHLELARNIAQRFNSRFGELFPLPEAAIPASGDRVMDLQEPDNKTSTTRGTPQGTVLVVDPPEVVARKIRSAVTDSGREVRRGQGKQGIENLIEIL